MIVPKPAESFDKILGIGETLMMSPSLVYACEGIPPYVNPEIPYVNDPKGVGVSCKECRHFYEFPTAPFYSAYHEEIIDPKPLLKYYILLENWECAVSRVRIAPEEAKYRDVHGYSPLLTTCFISGANISFIRALIEADPNAVEDNENECGMCPLGVTLEEQPPSIHRHQILQALISANANVLLNYEEQAKYSSIMGKFGEDWQQHFQNVLDLPGNAVLNLRDYQTDTTELGVLPQAFKDFSLMVKADYHDHLNDDILTNAPILHAIAGCRDPYIFHLKKDLSFLAVCMQMFPGQLLQRDSNGNTPLHVAVSTLNRDQEEYTGLEHHEMIDDEHWQTERYQFLKSLCSHVEKLPPLKDFLKNSRCNLGRSHQYLGCSCPPDVSSGDEEDEVDCHLCNQKFWNSCLDDNQSNRKPSCACHNNFLKECDLIEAKRNEFESCAEAFGYYFNKMHDEHRFDKHAVIEKLLEANPEAASCGNNQGRLPIHLAVGEGKKRWEGGLQILVEAYPEGVGIKDPTNGLYPFMTSAMTSDLDACFELLCFRPYVLGPHYWKKTKDATWRSAGKRQREE